MNHAAPSLNDESEAQHTRLTRIFFVRMLADRPPQTAFQNNVQADPPAAPPRCELPKARNTRGQIRKFGSRLVASSGLCELPPAWVGA